MQVLPSKELLSEVLDKGKGSITKIEYNPSKTIVEYEQLERYWNSINTYELAHKCKEWAISKGWVLHEVRNLKEYIIYFSGDFREPSNDFRANTEPEAIFKACEWIMEHIK